MSDRPETAFERDLAVLELGPDATLAQVKSAYLRLKKLYSADSPLLSPIARDFPEEKRLRILLEVEEAYHGLLEHFHIEHSEEALSGTGRAPIKAAPSGRGPVQPKAPAAPAAEPVFTGPVLKKIREDLGIPIQAIFQATKIRVEQLEAIESESFDKLPDEAYLRIQLKEYAGHLLLNPKKVIGDYLKRFAEWRRIHPPPGRQ